MTRCVSLLFGVHAHQPVGNFPRVLDEAHGLCYRPFLQTLHRYPEFQFAAHFSGWLLDYLLKHYPEDMALLREMVARGQVELFGGGDMEPVLAAIPYRDRLGQLRALSIRLQRELGQKPHGAWLTERVWEATVVPALADSGVRYVTVDDYHFLCTGREASELDGFFSTEEDGRVLDLFPISEALRYRLPFAPAADAVAYLESLARQGGRAAAIYFDDIEKFGIWPETHEWVYEKGWLEEFIRGVLASPLIRTERYGEYHATANPRGVVYLPTTSYSEMNEWTLPAQAAQRYGDLVAAQKAAGLLEGNKPFLRGGIWKNFFSRYPEANWMHKRMLALSARLAHLATPPRAMTEALYRAQANDAYWHGLFGGLYLPHLRRAVYQAIVELEARLDRVVPRPASVWCDLDLDGCEEVFLHNHAVQAVVRLDGTASVCEFDSYVLRHNFGDTLARQAEHYHRRIRQAQIHMEGATSGIASAHDRVSFKDRISPADLVTDTVRPGLFVDRVIAAPGPVPPGPCLGYRVSADAEVAHGLAFAASIGKGVLEKTLQPAADGINVSYKGIRLAGTTLACEINLAMPSSDGPAGRYWVGGQCPGGFGQPQALSGITEVTLEDDVLGGCLVLSASRPVDFSAAPYHSVSQSEAGFEKIMQAVTLTLTFQPEDEPLALTLRVIPR